MKKSVLAAAAFASMIFGATSANAAKTFNLSGVTFSDGSTVTGSFTTNDAVSAVTNYSIATSGFLAQTYTQANGFASINSSSLSFTAYGFIFDQVLRLDLSRALSTSGASVTGGSESVFILSRSVANGGTVSLSTTPAVPEPATWALMILGMGAVGFAMRRRKIVNMTIRFA